MDGRAETITSVYLQEKKGEIMRQIIGSQANLYEDFGSYGAP